MKVADQNRSTLKSWRANPASVRLEARLVAEICAGLRPDAATRPVGTAASGLLFGTIEGFVHVKAWKPLSTMDDINSASLEVDDLDAVFEASLARAKMDPALTSLNLVGWYRVCETDATPPLLDLDIAFHNRRFRRAADVALMLTHKQHTGVLLELYSRSSSERAISRQDQRFGSLLVNSAVGHDAFFDVNIRESVHDDYHVRVLQVLNSLDRGEKREKWKRITLPFRTITRLSLRPEPTGSRIAPDIQRPAPEISALPVETTTRMMSQPGHPATSQVNSALLGSPGAEKKLRWLSTAVLLLLGTGFALAWVYSGSFLSALPREGIWFGTGGTTHLAMRVDPHVDGSLLLRWNTRSALVHSAKAGVLHVDDGTEHRKLHLDSNELANGSILYTPTSRDVMFRLEVFDGKGAPVSESMRVVNASDSGWAADSIGNARPSSSVTTAPVPKEKDRSLVAASRANAPRSAIQENVPRVELNSGQSSRAPALNARLTPVGTFAARPSARPSGTASDIKRPSRQKAGEPERKRQATRNPATTGSAFSTEEESSKTDSSSAPQELRKAVQNLPSAHSRPSSTAPAAMKNSAARSPVATYVPARPLKQVMPNTSMFASSELRTSSDVEVEVRIDDGGRVADARIVEHGSNDNPVLADAALAAAKEWLFEPAKVQGKKVASDHAIKFHFRAQ